MHESDEIDYERDELMLAARRLPRDIAPARDLWPGIAEAIERQDAARAQGGHRWSRLFAQAAAVLLLVGGSSGITWLAMKEDAQPVVVQPAGQALQYQSVAGSFGPYHLGPDFMQARDNLAARLDEELERLPPETRLEVEANLETIRGAIIEINQALADQPDNALLQELLINAYREELSVMSHVDGMASSLMRRSDI